MYVGRSSGRACTASSAATGSMMSDSASFRRASSMAIMPSRLPSLMSPEIWCVLPSRIIDAIAFDPNRISIAATSRGARVLLWPTTSTPPSSPASR